MNAIQTQVVIMTLLQDRTQVLFQDTHLVLKDMKQLLDTSHQVLVDQINLRSPGGSNTPSSGGRTKSSSTAATKSTSINATTNVGVHRKKV